MRQKERVRIDALLSWSHRALPDLPPRAAAPLCGLNPAGDPLIEAEKLSKQQSHLSVRWYLKVTLAHEYADASLERRTRGSLSASEGSAGYLCSF